MKNWKPSRNIYLPAILVILIISVSGCDISPNHPAPGSAETGPFRPPTLAPSPIPTVELVDTPTTQKPSIDCVNQLTFVSDITIPDRTAVEPGATLDKRWEVENTGSCNWDERYSIQLITGAEMGADPKQALYPARSESKAEIRIQFTVPDEPGPYRSAWQACSPDGQPFGDLFYIEVVVVSSTTE